MRHNSACYPPKKVVFWLTGCGVVEGDSSLTQEYHLAPARIYPAVLRLSHQVTTRTYTLLTKKILEHTRSCTYLCGTRNLTNYKNIYFFVISEDLTRVDHFTNERIPFWIEKLLIFTRGFSCPKKRINFSKSIRPSVRSGLVWSHTRNRNQFERTPDTYLTRKIYKWSTRITPATEKNNNHRHAENSKIDDFRYHLRLYSGRSFFFLFKIFFIYFIFWV